MYVRFLNSNVHLLRSCLAVALMEAMALTRTIFGGEPTQPDHTNVRLLLLPLAAAALAAAAASPAPRVPAPRTCATAGRMKFPLSLNKCCHISTHGQPFSTDPPLQIKSLPFDIFV